MQLTSRDGLQPCAELAEHPLLADPDEPLFGRIANDLRTHGHSVIPDGLPTELAQSLLKHSLSIDPIAFSAARIGRHSTLLHDPLIRSDEISWLSEESNVGRQWLSWIANLQSTLNRELFLGLYSFESHLAHYPANAFYQRHSDAFVGQSERILSLVTYLNPDWNEGDGGELVLYRHESDTHGIAIPPRFGTLVLFLSEEFPHEVRLTHRDRYSVAGWFRRRSRVAGVA